MPTYIVSASGDLLDRATKARLAAAVTTIHRDVTGADAIFARVVFRTIEADDCFLGGEGLVGPHCFIDGRIRAGRTRAVRDELVKGIVRAVADIVGVPSEAVWLYLAELPPAAMVEYGRPLPEPGDEAAWLEGLPDAERDFVPAKPER